MDAAVMNPLGTTTGWKLTWLAFRAAEGVRAAEGLAWRAGRGKFRDYIFIIRMI
jgi:hypothetical protein